MAIGGTKLAEAFVRVRADQKTLRKDMTGIRAFFSKSVAGIQRQASAAFRPLRGLLGIAGGVGGLALARKTISLAVEQEQVEAKLAAVLKATGNAAGFSARELNTFAGELQEVTTFGDEATIQMIAVLATFKEIRGPAFKDTVRVIQDMATVLGTDMRSAAIQVGKALNDPLIGLTALSRSGVSFTEKQKDLIKTLTKSGNLMEAQAIILQELKSEFGGAAEAIGKTMGGQLKQFTNRLGDMGEQIGKTLLRHLLPLTKQMEALVGWFTLNNERIIASAIEFGKLALKIGAAVVAIRLVIAVIGVLVAAQKALALAQAALLALSGPRGWAILAGSVAAVAASSLLIAQHFGEIQKRIAASVEEAKRLAKATKEIAENTKPAAAGKSEVIKRLERQVAAAKEGIAFFKDLIEKQGMTLSRERGLEIHRRSLIDAERRLLKAKVDLTRPSEPTTEQTIGRIEQAKQDKEVRRRASVEKRNADLLANLRFKAIETLGRVIGKPLGRAANLVTGAAGLAPRLLAGAVRRPEPEAPGRGGFTGLADLSRSIQLGIFGSQQERLQQKQAEELAKIRDNTKDMKDGIVKMAGEVFGVFVGGD